MMITHRLALLPLIVLAGCACGHPEDAPTPGAGALGTKGATGGTVVVDGSSTVFRISKAAQEGFATLNDKVTVVVDIHGTGAGFTRYLEGEVDVIDASRDAKPEETEMAKKKGFDWTRFLVGYDGITLVVNPKNDFVKALSVAQLKKLWEPESKVTTWKDLDPTWPARKIVLYAPDADSGTFEFFTEAITSRGKQRKDYQPSADDNTLVKGVIGDADSIGYFGYAYYVANKTKLRAVPIKKDESSEPVAPTPETVLNKTYAPLARPLYIFVKNSAMARTEVKEFVTYYLDNVTKLAPQAKYVAPTAEDVEANKAALEAVQPSTSKQDKPVG